MSNLSITASREVSFAISRMNKEAAMHFCRLAQAGAEFKNAVYPTGLRTVIAEARGEKAEVILCVAKQLRSAGFKVAA